MRKIVIAAGSGFLGQVLCNHFKNKDTEIIILTRGKSEILNHIKYVHWDAKNLSGWEKELENCDLLVNLAGKSVNCRYTAKNKKEILDSRIDSTKILNTAVLKCKNPPKHFINSSTATIYRHSLDKQMDEYTGETGNDFSMNIAKNWEKVFYETETPRTLKTAIRTSIVLGRKGGAFIPLKNLVKFYLGGKQGNGNQFVSWIHEADFAAAVEWIYQNKLCGKINVVSPNPIRNKDFMKALRTNMKVPLGLPAPKMMLEIGAKIIGTETELILKSRNVIPKKLEESGFNFRYDDINATFKNLLL